MDIKNICIDNIWSLDDSMELDEGIRISFTDEDGDGALILQEIGNIRGIRQHLLLERNNDHSSLKPISKPHAKAIFSALVDKIGEGHP